MALCNNDRDCDDLWLTGETARRYYTMNQPSSHAQFRNNYSTDNFPLKCSFLPFYRKQDNNDSFSCCTITDCMKSAPHIFWDNSLWYILMHDRPCGYNTYTYSKMIKWFKTYTCIENRVKQISKTDTLLTTVNWCMFFWYLSLNIH